MGTECFWLEPTDQQEVRLRRYVHLDSGGWTCGEGWHQAVSEPVAVEPWLGQGEVREPWDPDDPRWPAYCDSCEFHFGPDVVKQTFTHRLFERADTGERMRLRDAPPGAMWDAEWMPSAHKQPDGRYLVVKLPNGRDWAIDGHASNCTRPGEDHDCWCRHGEPPDLTIDKTPLPGRSTCAAGAGSIGSEGYHGFLRDGVLT